MQASALCFYRIQVMELFECIPFHKLNKNACLYLFICNKISSIAKKKEYYDIVEIELNVVCFKMLFT